MPGRQQQRKRISSRRDPRIGPITDRSLLKRVGLAQRDRGEDNADQKTAEIVKLQRCDPTTYDGGRGFETKFEYSPSNSTRCFLTGDGNVGGLTLLVRVNQVYADPNPTIMHTFRIPADDDALTSLRLFDKGMLIEIHVDPKREGRQKPIGDYWSILFRAHSKDEVKRARGMMRWIEALTREMPNDRFKYRNFFTKVGLAADGRAQLPLGELTEGYYVYELSSGHSMTFTGHLATAPFLKALGHTRVRPARPVSVDPEESDVEDITQQPRQLRSMIGEGAYAFSSLTPSGAISVSVQRKGRADKVLKKREARHGRRAARLASTESSDSVSSGPLQTYPFESLVIPFREAPVTTGEREAPGDVRAPSMAAADGSSHSSVPSDDDDDDAEAPEFPINTRCVLLGHPSPILPSDITILRQGHVRNISGNGTCSL
ncbi:MAG: hypothetical protein Q9207_002512 [Kuettlingeria erythrocarpa]